ncbi:Bifunctional protein FolC, partial [termite gut metagenome]
EKSSLNDFIFIGGSTFVVGNLLNAYAASLSA